MFNGCSGGNGVCFKHLTGLENKVEKKKIYRNKLSRLAISYFRKGLSIIKAKIWSLRMFINVLNDIFKNADQGKLLYVK